MCDYSSFSSIDKLRLPRRRGAGGAGSPHRALPGSRRPDGARAAIASRSPSPGATSATKNLKSIVSPVNGRLFSAYIYPGVQGRFLPLNWRL